MIPRFYVRAWYRPAGLLVAAAALAPAVAAQGVPDSIPDGTVLVGRLSYDAKATMGDFTGATTEVTGSFTGGPLQRIGGRVEALASNLATGNGKRDRDMYKSLEVERFPTIVYALDSLTVGAKSGDTAETTFHGAFTVHGVTRESSFPARLVFEDTLVRVRAETPMNLKDYDIGGLSKFLGILKMDEMIVVHIDLVFVTTPPPAGRAEEPTETP